MQTVLELIVDYSLSMGPYKYDDNTSTLLPDGSTRMDLAKKVLVNDIVPALDYTGIIGIRRFYSKSGKPIIEDIYQGPFNKSDIISKINSFTAPTNTGGTPISAALERSINYLRGCSESDRKIILVTDGEENEGSNFRATVEKALKNYGINYNIFIVGIGQSASTAEKCKELADATKGGYVNLETKSYDKSKLSDVLRPLTLKAVGATIANVQQKNVNAITSLESSNNNTKIDKVEKYSFNDEVLKVLKGHSQAIDLLNRQLQSIGASGNSATEKVDRCLQKIGEINLNESLGKLQASFKSDLSQHEKASLSALTEVNRKLEIISKEAAQMSIAAKDGTRLDKLKGSLATQLQSIQTSVEKCRADVEGYAKDVSGVSLVGAQLKAIQDMIDTATKDQLYIRETLGAIQSSLSSLSEKQKRRDRFRNVAIGVCALILSGCLAVLAYKFKFLK